jgi:hypothetical protein
MEDMWLRIPHILEQVNELLDDKNLVNCKEASRIMNFIIENQKSGKFITTRMIQSYIRNPEEVAKNWRIIIEKLPNEKLSEFGTLVKDFYNYFPSRFEENWEPMHIVADRGHLDFCRFIAKVSTTKSYKFSPLLLSAQAGHLEVCKFLYEEIEDKNHKTSLDQLSAQHLAAKNGHLEVYMFLHKNSNEINPSMQENITPLHLAAQHGHFDVCKYICDNTVHVRPYRLNDQMTPLSLAILRGHFKISRLLIERDAWNLGMKFLLIICLFFFFLSVLECNFCENPKLCDKLLNVCKIFNEPIEFIVRIIGISIFLTVILMTLMTCVMISWDVQFCATTSLRFEY